MATGDCTTNRVLSVIVKGDRFHAAMAAAERGIPFAFKTETRTETVGRIPYAYLDCVAAWFASDADHGAPYPVGSCLLYSTVESEPGCTHRRCPVCDDGGPWCCYCPRDGAA